MTLEERWAEEEAKADEGVRRCVLYEIAVGKTYREILDLTDEPAEWVGSTLGGLCRPCKVGDTMLPAVLRMAGGRFEKVLDSDKATDSKGVRNRRLRESAEPQTVAVGEAMYELYGRIIRG